MSEEADKVGEEAKVEQPKTEEPKVESKIEAAQPADPNKAPQWAMDQIQKWRARARAAEQAKATGQAAPLNPQSGQPFTPEQIAHMDNLASQKAAQIASDTTFNERCNEARSKGEAQFADFSQKLNQLIGLVDNNDASSRNTYKRFLETALETGNAAKVIHMMGSDLNLASRVLGLSPIKMALEVGKMAEEKGAREPSKAPKPIESVGSRSPIGHAKADDPDRASEMSTADWMKARNAQAKERGFR